MFLDVDLMHNLLIALLPFVICLAAVLAIVRLNTKRGGRSDEAGDDSGR